MEAENTPPEGGPTVEQQARDMGWVPREQFRGDQGHWVDADIFVERGHTMMPILRANNRRLEEQLQRQSREMQELRTSVTASQEQVTEMQKVHAEATKMAVDRAKEQLKAQLRAARESGDVDAEFEVRERIDELNTVTRTPAPTPAPKTPAEPEVHPDFNAWRAENAWFGTDPRRTLKANGIAQELRSDPENDTLVGRPFFDKVVEVMQQREGTNTKPMQKVGGGGGSSGGGAGSAGGKGYSSLPPDAREACDRQGKKLIGPGKAFKDASAWQQYYCNIYFTE